MDDHISAIKEAHQRYKEAVKAVENHVLMLDMLIEKVKNAGDDFLSEEKRALEFVRVKGQQLEEQQAALEERPVKSDLSGSDHLSIQAAGKDLDAFRQFLEEHILLPKCLDQAEPDPKKNT